MKKGFSSKRKDRRYKKNKRRRDDKKDSLVKIGTEIHNEVKDLVKESVEFPSVKNFVERAVRIQLSNIMFDIPGNTRHLFIEKYPENQINKIMFDLPQGMKKILRKNKAETFKSDKHFTNCLVCDKVFLAKINEKEGSRICPRCKEVIKYFSDKLD